MPTSDLLEKLLEIERSLGRKDDLTIRGMLMDAQVELLRVQAEVISVLEDMNKLREQQERYPRSALSPSSARAEKPRPVVGLAHLAAKSA
jgi:hypothetical protein